MKSVLKIIATSVAAIFTVSILALPPVYSITIKEEEEMSRQMMALIYKHFKFVDDPEVVAYVNKIGYRILAALPKQPFKYHFHVVNQEVYNAFATPAGHIFIYSGLLNAMEEEEELAGIIGHEIAHVYCRHISQKIERSKKIGLATLAGVAAGVLLGAGGAGEVGSAVTMGSAAAGQSAELSFSRDDEMQSDQLGLDFITKAGYNAEGLLKILKKIRGKTWFGSDQIPSYLMTHPAVEDRISYIGSWIENRNRKFKPIPLVNPDEFNRIHTRVETRYGNEATVLSKLEAEVARNPQDPMAHYRYGLILARVGKRPEAIQQMRSALTKRAFDAYILKDLGWIYFLDGQFSQALNILENACGMIPEDPECLFFLGRTQMELGDLPAASDNFIKLTRQHPHFAPGFFYLGQSLGQQQKLGDAHYYLGIFHYKKRDYKNAVIQLKQALKHKQAPERRQKIEKWLSEISAAQSKK
ncbi:MAG: M48 family metalloprotease [Desulfobacterales bacterium]|nr:M48 family metalloprotease [Desulfobacterales bacterium]